MVYLFRQLNKLKSLKKPCVIAIGAFDGVHIGHQALLKKVAQRAAEIAIQAAVLSFEPLPRQFFAKKNEVVRLTTPRQRIQLFIQSGMHTIGLLKFNHKLAHMSEQDFIKQILVDYLHVTEVWVGPDFHFGRNRAGDLETLKAFGLLYNFSAHSIAPVIHDGQRVSATVIRQLLEQGQFQQVAILLGRKFTMTGHVVHGQKLGRKLGYPTANLRIPFGKAPVHGIFAVRVSTTQLKSWPAVACLGTRPTVNGVEPLLESHLFDFDGDLYGQRLTVEFVSKIRDEICFSDLDALVTQMHQDALNAREILQI